MVRAGIGVAPWDVLTQGISLRTGLPFGLVTNIVGAVVLLLWIPIRRRVGFGTVAQRAADRHLRAARARPSSRSRRVPWLQALVFAGGLALLAVATGLYIGARLGPGPRDGLMTGLHRRTGWPIWIVRTSIEVIVLAVGWALGGQFGIGTIAFALLIGPMVGVTLPAAAHSGAGGLTRPPAPEADADYESSRSA